MAERSVKVNLVANTSQYQAAMSAAAKSTKDFGQSAQATGPAAARAATGWKGLGQRVSTEVGVAARAVDRLPGGVQVAAAGVAVGVAAIGMASAQAASDLAETTSKVGVLFGSQATAIESWAAGAATAFGQSRQQAMDAAATFATFGKAAGLSGADLTGFSTDLTELASDMASFSNTTVDEAIQAIGSALRGESEPIRAYGVLLDDASMRAEALRMGLIATTTQALTPQQKVLAAQALILRQTSAAQGDFARTSEGAANSARILAAEAANAQAKLGESLLPAQLAVTRAAAGMLGVLGKVPGPVQAAGLAVVGAAASFVVLAPRVMEAKRAYDAMALAAPRATGATMAVGKAAGIAAIAFVAAGAATDALTSWMARGNTSADQFSASLTRGGRDADVALSNVRDSLANTSAAGNVFVSVLAGPFGALRSVLNSSTQETQALDAALARMVGEGSGIQAADAVSRLGLSADQAASLLPAYTAAVTAAGGAATIAAAQVPGMAAGINAAGAAATAAVPGTMGWGKAAGDAAKQSLAAAAAANRVSAAMAAMMGTLSAATAIIAAKEATAAFTASLRENGKALDLNSPKGQANVKALSAAATATLQARDAQARQLATTMSVPRANAQADAAMLASVRALRATAIAAGVDKDAFDALTASVGLLPKSASTTVTAPGAPAAKSGIDAVTSAARAVPGTASTAVSTPGSAAARDALADVRNRANAVPDSVSTSTSAPGAIASAFGLGRVSTAAFSIPNSRYVTVSASTGSAVSQIGSVAAAINRLPTSRTITVITRNITSMFSSGGEVHGPGTSTSDSIPAMLSDGEYVMRAAAVDKYGPGLMHRINSLAFASGGLVRGYAAGGSVAENEAAAAAYAAALRESAMLTASTAAIARLGKRLNADARARLAAMSVEERYSTVRGIGRGGRYAPEAFSRSSTVLADVERRRAAAEARQARLDKVKELRESRAAESASIASRYVGAAGIVGAHDFKAAAAATRDLADARATLAKAEDDLFEARRAVNRAGTPDEQAAATRRLAEAEAALSAARTGVATATRANAAAANTPGNVLKGFQSRAAKLAKFQKNLKALSWLPKAMIQQLIEAGVESGGETAEALVAMNVNQRQGVIAAQNSITASAGLIGGQGAGLTWDARIAAAELAAGLAPSRASQKIEITGSQPIVVKVDGRQVYGALMDLARRSGGSLSWTTR